MSEERVAIYAGTRNIYHDMAVSAKSLLYHNGADRVVFLIEDDDFPESLPDCIVCMNVSKQTYFRTDGPNYTCQWTYMVMMRTAITKLFPYLNRALVLDHDTIIRQPLDELWAIDLDGYYYALAEENYISHRSHPYYNFGVAMHNLKELRKDHADDAIINAVNSIHFVYCEQDAVNSLCRDKILALPTKFNMLGFNQPPVYEEDIVIRHYAAGRRPLSQFGDYRLFDAMSWDEVLNHESERIISMIGMKRYDIINCFIRERGYKSFLEIGTGTGETYRNVMAQIRVSVDPDPTSSATYRMTSDEFFGMYDGKFDIIFIDGLHECYQALRDVVNAMDHLNDGGVIIMHDCLPTSERMQTPCDHYPGGEWTGDVWKTFVVCRKVYACESYTIDTDFGCGVFDRRIAKKQNTLDLPGNFKDMTYQQYTEHPEWMNKKGGIIRE